MSSPIFDCTACGACCLGGSDRYVALMPHDLDRAIPDGTTTLIEGRHYMRMTCGHCAQLTVTAEGQTLCAIYVARPEACRAFRAGSFECLKARQHRGPQAEALRALAVAEPLAPMPAPVMVPVAALVAPPPDEAISPSP